MRIAIGSDHRGFQLKEKINSLLKSKGIDVEDVGTHTSESVDYTEYALAVSKQVSSGSVDRGILICGTGIGMSIAANKFSGVRAAPIGDEVTSEISRRHNDLNVLCLSADLLSLRTVDRLVEIWVETEFEGGRHQRRIDRIASFECCSEEE